jgi:acetolactate synthase I/II/III large subunit
MRSGGQVLVDQLIIQGVTRVTCVPGESYLAALDALYDADIDVLICRNEAGAAMMAEAQAKLTQRPGICFVTRGPGAMNAAHGIHIAYHDETPLIMFVGQVERKMRGRGAFQELDYTEAFLGIAKWVVEIDEAKRIPEIVGRAFRVAMQGRPGPVVISLPEDMLTDVILTPDVPFVTPVFPMASQLELEQTWRYLTEAQRPMIIAGGSQWDTAGIEALNAFSERFELPVATEFRRTALMRAHSPSFVGDLGFGPNPDLAKRVKEADLILLLGGRMSEVPSSSYSLINLPVPEQTLIHVYPDASELGRVYQPHLAIMAQASEFAKALNTLAIIPAIGWAEHTKSARKAYLDWTETPTQISGTFQYGEVMVWLRDTLPQDTIIANGAGNYAIWVHRYWRHNRPFTQIAPTSGSVGYSVPAGIMAKRECPDKTVVIFAGDGCFLMNGNELATALQYDIAVIIIVIDNGMYGTIRMHQERDYPKRVVGTDLKNPDFAALARAYGGHGETVRETQEFMPAFMRAKASGKASVIHCFLDPQAITPGKRLDEMGAL